MKTTKASRQKMRDYTRAAQGNRLTDIIDMLLDDIEELVNKTETHIDPTASPGEQGLEQFIL